MENGGSVGSSRTERFRPERNGTLDTLRWAKKRLQVPTLLEVDVTAARRAIRAYRNRTGEGMSFTAWVVSCVARSAAEHPRVHSLRLGKHRIVLFDEVDVSVLVERRIGAETGGETLPMPFVVRRAEAKSPGEIHEEIRAAQEARLSPGAASIEESVPPWVQALFFRLQHFGRS